MTAPVRPAPSPRPVAAEPDPPPRSPGRLVVGLLLVLAGVAWMVEAAGVASLRWPLLLAGALVVVGAGLLLAAGRGGHDGLVVLGIALAVAALAAPFGPAGSSWAEVGDRTVTPRTAAELADPVALTAGSLTVDLRQLHPDEAPTGALRASVAFGELVVLLPAEAAAEVAASVGAGEVAVVDLSNAGVGASLDARVPGATDPWQMELTAGFGRVEVRR